MSEKTRLTPQLADTTYAHTLVIKSTHEYKAHGPYGSNFPYFFQFVPKASAWSTKPSARCLIARHRTVSARPRTLLVYEGNESPENALNPSTLAMKCDCGEQKVGFHGRTTLSVIQHAPDKPFYGMGEDLF